MKTAEHAPEQNVFGVENPITTLGVDERVRKNDSLWTAGAAIAMTFLAISAYQQRWRLAGVFALGIIAMGAMHQLFKRLKTPLWLQAWTVALALSAWIGGDALGLYNSLWWWDLMLHGAAGALITLIAYHWLSSKEKAAAIIAFLIAMGAGALWELWEFAWGVSTPTTPLFDTITDLAVKAVFAGVAAIISANSSFRTRKHL